MLTFIAGYAVVNLSNLKNDSKSQHKELNDKLLEAVVNLSNLKNDSKSQPEKYNNLLSARCCKPQ